MLLPMRAIPTRSFGCCTKRLGHGAVATISEVRALIRLLNRLEAAGYIVRIADPDDHRARVLVLTPAAISNGKLFPYYNPKRSASSYGVRLPVACCPASTAG